MAQKLKFGTFVKYIMFEFRYCFLTLTSSRLFWNVFLVKVNLSWLSLAKTKNIAIVDWSWLKTTKIGLSRLPHLQKKHLLKVVFIKPILLSPLKFDDIFLIINFEMGENYLNLPWFFEQKRSLLFEIVKNNFNLQVF